MYIKNKKTLTIIILFHYTLFQTCFANHIETVEEILRFCNHNAHWNIAILVDQDAKIFTSFMKSQMHNIRIKSFFYKKESNTLDTIDTLILKKDLNSLRFDDILKMMSTRKRKKSILAVRESEVEEFKVSTYDINCIFHYITNVLYTIIFLIMFRNMLEN